MRDLPVLTSRDEKFPNPETGKNEPMTRDECFAYIEKYGRPAFGKLPGKHPKS